MQNVRSILDIVCAEIKEMTSKEYFISEYCEYLVSLLGCDVADNLIDMIFGGDKEQNHDFCPELAVFFYWWGYTKCQIEIMTNVRRGFCKMSEGVLQNVRRLNNNNNNNNLTVSLQSKESFIKDSLKIENSSKKLTSCKDNCKNNLKEMGEAHFSYRGQNDFSSKNESAVFESAASCHEKPELPAFVQEEKENPETNNHQFDEIDYQLMDASLESYKRYKKQQNLPFIPVHEVDEYIADIRNCLDRADKIYINQIWEICHELYDIDEQYDDYGELLYEASTNIEKVPVYKERLYKDILHPAFDKVQELIEKGYVEVEGEKYPITAKIENPSDFEMIVDWETCALGGTEVDYIISKERFRNIYEEEIKPIQINHRRRRSAEEKQADYDYMRKIIVYGDDDKKFEELTPLELSIYNFLVEYYEIDKDCNIVDMKMPYINQRELRQFYATKLMAEISQQEFLSTINNLEIDKKYGSLTLRPTMFNAQAIKRQNAIRGFLSAIAA